MVVSVERIDIPKSMKQGDEPIAYTPDSLKAVVVAVAHLLDHFADSEHPALQEPQHRRRRVTGTGVLVYPKVNNHINRVGYQLFVTNPIESQRGDGRGHTVGVVFDMRAYEKLGDRYLFNMLGKLTQSIRESHRPSDDELRAMSTRFMLAN